MGMFVISKRTNGDYKFVFTSRKGKTIFTSLSCKQKSDCEKIIEAIAGDISQFTFRKNSTPSGKHFFRLSKDGFILATSRKYSTPLMLQKGIDEITKYVLTAEILDFSADESIFPPEEEVFADATENN
ncbi:DUF1508 domain-containing protein [Flavobacterium alkalisoli]|uniref:DUF1508 domain-containing protein n=1 Tax=Flavobacterium alkalisoli TaxID=2602769 RepID=A0A5B9FTS8_9FLAO|nr:DUF1508 domain-containing protein [Flavobacterium alkalisoli]QEE49018.1 DUF1508 domain-containing protein [Flavobacterium alkalisoli]